MKTKKKLIQQGVHVCTLHALFWNSVTTRKTARRFRQRQAIGGYFNIYVVILVEKCFLFPCELAHKKMV